MKAIVLELCPFLNIGFFSNVYIFFDVAQYTIRIKDTNTNLGMLVHHDAISRQGA